MERIDIKTIILSLVTLALTTPSISYSRELYWELGAGVGMLQLPHYIGSNESKNYVLPFPYVVIKSDLLSIDRNVVHGHLLSSDIFKFDIGFSAAFKVDSSKNKLRSGMPDLDYALEAGPVLKWLIDGEFNTNYELTFDLPVHKVFVTDFNDINGQGWRAKPMIHLRNKFNGNSYWQLDNSIQWLYGSDDYNKYYYSVDSNYVTAERPFYNATSGYSGWRYNLSIRQSKKNMLTGFFMNYTNIRNSVFDDSPLIAEKNSFSLGFFITWFISKGSF